VSDPAGPSTRSGGWWLASDGRWYPDSSPPGPAHVPAPAAPAAHQPTAPSPFQPYAPPTFQPMAAPAAWGGPPVPHRPPEPPRSPGRAAVVVALGVVAVAVLAVGALVTFSGDEPEDRASPSTGDTAPLTVPTVAPTTPTSQVVTEDLLGSLNVQQDDIGSSWQPVETGTLGQGDGGCQFPATGVTADHVVSYALRLNGVSGTLQAHLTAVTTVFVDDESAVHQEGLDGSDEHGECLRVDSDDRWAVASGGASPPGTIARQETGVTPPSAGWRYRTTLAPRAGGGELVAYTDYVIVRRGRVRLALSMLSIDVPFDPVLKQLLIDRVAERVAATIKAQD